MIEITGCPHEQLERTTYDALRAADFWRRGIPPVGGGMLDQTEWTIEAAEFVWSDQANWKARKGIVELSDG